MSRDHLIAAQHFEGELYIKASDHHRSVRAAVAAERNKLAQWMIDRGYATGHGDTTEDLLQELEWQIAENWTRGMVNGVQAEREACADECVRLAIGGGVAADCAAAIRARGQH
jgi:hypothetical protein